MNRDHLKRTLFNLIEHEIERTPLIELYGPRRSGKTTLMQSLMKNNTRYLSLSDPRMQAIAREHPESFLDLNHPPVFFDDIEACPGLLDHILRRISSGIPEPGQYLIAGTVKPDGLEQFSSSIRKTFTLFPLSMREISGYPDSVFYWEDGPHNQGSFLAGPFLWENFLRGGFPEILTSKEISYSQFYSIYLSEYLQKDILPFRKKAVTEPFKDFLRLLARRTGEPLNLSEMARNLHTTLHIVKMWLSLMEKTHQVFLLPSYEGRSRSPLIKASKAYFTNTGLLCFLLDITDPGKAPLSSWAPVILETAVLNEILRSRYHRGKEPGISFWRKATGMEVSLILEDRKGLVALETTPSSKPESTMSKGIRFLRKEIADPGMRGYVINPGRSSIPLAEGIESLPLCNL
ncbi:MAG: ATP-binding protein [Synergistales bacterium]|nr:ATP-binding protein [Synergistales bacterium]